MYCIKINTSNQEYSEQLNLHLLILIMQCFEILYQAVNSSLRDAQSQLQEIYSSKDKLQRSFLGSDLGAMEQELTAARLATDQAQKDVVEVSSSTSYNYTEPPSWLAINSS